MWQLNEIDFKALSLPTLYYNPNKEIYTLIAIFYLRTTAELSWRQPGDRVTGLSVFGDKDVSGEEESNNKYGNFPLKLLGCCAHDLSALKQIYHYTVFTGDFLHQTIYLCIEFVHFLVSIQLAAVFLITDSLFKFSETPRRNWTD